MKISSKPLAQTAPLAPPRPPPPPPPPQVHTRPADTFEQARSTRATTLRNEVLGDGQRNCLESAVLLARPGDSLVLMDDKRDGSGHALVLAPDGSVRDPNNPQVRYESLGQWQAMHPQYQRAATVPADRVRTALSIPPGPARDAALQKLGLGGAANVAVADATPKSWVTIDNGTNIRREDGARVGTTSGTTQAEVLAEVDEDSELDRALDAAAGSNEQWVQVRLPDGETGYVARSRTDELTEFQTDRAFSGMDEGLGAPTAPATTDEQGSLVQPFENGQLTLRADGVRVVEVEGQEPRELPPEWKSVSTGGGFFTASGTRLENAQGNEPVQVLRELGDDEDNNLDAVASGTWYEVRRQDGSTAFVFEERLGDLQADGSVEGLALPELGAPVSPLVPAEGGGHVQQFENGSIAIDAQGNKRVTSADGEVLAERPSGTFDSVADANAHHVTQRGRYVAGELTGNDYNAAPEWDGYNDCGPTSVVMVASMVGAQPYPGAEGAQAAIDHARDLAFPELTDTDFSRLTGAERLATSLRSLGASATVHSPSSIDAIEAALESGNPVIIGGQPFDTGAWGSTTEGYLESGGGFSHWVVVSGMTPEGDYIINDPLAPNGAIVVDRETLEAFLDPSMGMVEASPDLTPPES